MEKKINSLELVNEKLDEAAWEMFSAHKAWTEKSLEKFQDKVDWTMVCLNDSVHWTTSMLEKFKDKMDWRAFANTSQRSLLTMKCLERFQDYWDWAVLSVNTNLKLSYKLIDKFYDKWDWLQLINRPNYSEPVYTEEFLKLYFDEISKYDFMDSFLWRTLVDIREAKLEAKFK